MSSSLLHLHTQESPPQQVPKPRVRWWSRILVPALIVLGSASLLAVAAWRQLLPAPIVQVEPAVAKAVNERRPASVQVQAAGWLEAYPYQHHIGSLTHGVISDILVLEGDAVEAGQVIARLDPADAELLARKAKAQLVIRQAQHQEAQARLTAAQQTWQHPVELERRAATWEMELGAAAATVAENEARLQEQQAILAQARRDAERAKRLAASNVASQREAEQTAAIVEGNAAALQALERALESSKQRHARTKEELAAAKRDLTLRIADTHEIEAAKAAVARTEAAVALAEAELAEANLHLQRMEIVSPVAGVVVSRYKAPGDKVQLNTDSPYSATLISVYNPENLQVRVDVPLADAGQISPDQPCEIITDVLPDRTFTGRVLRILHEADIQKNTLPVKVAVDNPDPALRPEMLCRVRFLPNQQPETQSTARTTEVFVPTDAVSNGRIWLIRQADGDTARVESISIEDGWERDGWTAAEGLQVGALVVINPPDNLQPGQRVRLDRREVTP